MANPTTNYGWPMPTSTDLVTDLPADFAAFGQPVDTSLKALNPETTLGDISYRSATANTNTRLPIGTTGQVLAVSGGVPAWTTTADVTPLTTKGDLFTFTTVDARLGVGTNGQVLQADSAEATGLKWATVSSGAKFGQIVQADSTGQTTITSATFVASSLSGTITPTSATSKVLVQVTIPFYGPGGGQQMDLAIFRGTVASGTNLSPSNSLLWGTRAELQSGAMLFLDSPSTTSAQTYEIGAKVAGGTGYTINSPSRGVITLTEVLA